MPAVLDGKGEANLKKPVLLLIALFFAFPALAQPADWQKVWDATLTAAKKEGKVVIIGSPDPVMRKEVIPAFQARYPGINIEYIATASSGQAASRVRLERAAGIYSTDVYLSGPDTSYNVLYPEKMIDPLKPLMILPEVTNDANWKHGSLWFMDPEEQYVLRLYNTLQSSIFFNADRIKPEEMRTAQDLLNPKWRGKIVTDPPTNPTGTGGNQAASIYSQLGPEFVKKLYVDQKPVISSDRRQVTDWLARGTQYICLTCRIDDIAPMQKDGFNIVQVYELEGLSNRLVASPFLVTIANKAPNPNAARVFINWLATKEGIEIYSRGYGAASLRADADESFLDPLLVPRPDVTYPDDADPKWRSVEKVALGEKIKVLLSGE